MRASVLDPTRLQLTGGVAQIAHEIGLSDWQVSISHEENYAVAFVLLS
jgi:phosphopantetheinyl transferase (holo-ACP synthase)